MKAYEPRQCGVYPRSFRFAWYVAMLIAAGGGCVGGVVLPDRFTRVALLVVSMSVCTSVTAILASHIVEAVQLTNWSFRTMRRARYHVFEVVEAECGWILIVYSNGEAREFLQLLFITHDSAPPCFAGDWIHVHVSEANVVLNLIVEGEELQSGDWAGDNEGIR